MFSRENFCRDMLNLCNFEGRKLQNLTYWYKILVISVWICLKHTGSRKWRPTLLYPAAPTFVVTMYSVICCIEVVVSLSSPSCLWALSLIQLLHTVSHCRIPSEDRERSFRLLLVLKNMKRPMQRAGIAANEQTVGGWLLPHTSAAGGPRAGNND